ncbi:MAG: tRNA 2-thiouridine(34) synthase MnmA [Longimicrobiales bacterium]|nr:tRNA 2-thiouridine(34) synthase MnmA [Longimicrobiales bacterium]
MTRASVPRRTLVAMSGGVDSSLAAALLVEAGHDVIGATMKTFCYSGGTTHARSCCGLDGIVDARLVADRLGIPHYVFDVEEDFTRDVIDDFVSEYARGHTPNPCVRCNSYTKFGDLRRRARELGCDAIATGHYVRVRHDPGVSRLLRGRDHAKDQAYFLWGVDPSILPDLEFPVGELTKSEVRERARALGLVTADKPESQEICFVPTGDYRDLLEKRLAPRHPALEPGPLVLEDGTVVGEHDGYSAFTVGQRRGLGGGFGRPMFVLEVRPETREVVIGPREALAIDRVRIETPHWHGAPPDEGSRVAVQMRHRGDAHACRVTHADPETLLLTLDARCPAVAPGQSAVIFDGDEVLGGGRIAARLRPAPVSV